MIDNRLLGGGFPWSEQRADDAPGDVVTFYSYKGGTGRTMGLANCASLIAQNRSGRKRPVLAIDFDLEAPGLHRYIPPLTSSDEKALQRPGVLELFSALEERITKFQDNSGEPTKNNGALSDVAVSQLVDEFDFSEYICSTAIEGLFVMLAGNFDDTYDRRMAAFDWVGIHSKAPALFRCLSSRLADEYGFIFIDSRTGLSDTTGICTTLLPDVLVVVFTPNTQSLTGIEHVVRRAYAYRQTANDLRDLRVYALPSRVDNQVEHFRQVWRRGADAHPIFGSVPGYQPIFEKLFGEMTLTWGVREIALLDSYFDVVQVPHSADYAFGERLCVSSRASSDSLSVRGAYEQFLIWLLTGASPWEEPAKVAFDSMAIRWLRRSGGTHPPGTGLGWRDWFVNLTKVLDELHHPVLAGCAELSLDRRFDVALIVSLAMAYTRKFSEASVWLNQANACWTEETSSSVCADAPAELLGLLTMHRDDSQRNEELFDWLTLFDLVMKNWQPLKRERARWLTSLTSLASLISASRRAEVIWRAQAELFGETSTESLQALAELVDERLMEEDFVGAIQIQAKLVSLATAANNIPVRFVEQERLENLRLSLSRDSSVAPEESSIKFVLFFSSIDMKQFGDWVLHFSGKLESALRVSQHEPEAELQLVDVDLSSFDYESRRSRAVGPFFMVFLVSQNVSESHFFWRSVEKFVRIRGDMAADRMVLVAVSDSAYRGLIGSSRWKSLFVKAQPKTLPMFSIEDLEFRLPIYKDSRELSDVVSLTVGFLVDALSRAVSQEIRSARPIRIYVESSIDHRTTWELVDDFLQKRWLNILAKLNKSRRRLVIRAIPIDYLKEFNIDDADGIILFAVGSPSVTVAKIDAVESRLPGGRSMVRGLVINLWSERFERLGFSDLWGWPILNLTIEDNVLVPCAVEGTPSVGVESVEELQDVDRFLAALLDGRDRASPSVSITTTPRIL